MDPETSPVEETVEAPEASSPVEETSFTKFNMNDVPDEHREYVDAAYKQLQGDYTRKTQETAQARKEAEAAQAFFNDLQNDQTRDEALKWLAGNVGEQQLLAALGYDVGSDDDTTVDTPDEFRDPRVDQLLAEISQQKEQQAEAQFLDVLERSVEQQFKELDADVVDDDKTVIVEIAASMKPRSDGMPDIAGAYERLQKAWERQQKRWVESKRAPRVSTTGESGIKTPDLDDPAVRQAWMAQRLAELQSE